MINLTGKNADEINTLIQKYAKVLELINPQVQSHYAVIIDVAVNYIQEKYQDLTVDWKTWCFFALRKEFNKINNDSDVKTIIDEFVEYYKSKYQNYIDNLGMSASEFDRDYEFMCAFTHKKNR